MDPIFLSVDEVLDIHAIQVRQWGGDAGIRDLGLLESAVAQPQATFGGVHLHDDLFAMAAAYLYHLVENHPFVDGNKRTGLHAALAFLVVNGVSIPDPPPDVYNLTMKVASGGMKKEAVATFLRRHFTPPKPIRKRPRPRGRR